MYNKEMSISNLQNVIELTAKLVAVASTPWAEQHYIRMKRELEEISKLEDDANFLRNRVGIINKIYPTDYLDGMSLEAL